MDKKEQVRKELEELEKQHEEAQKFLAGDRDQILLDHILKEDKDFQNIRNDSFIDNDSTWAPTDKFRVAMIIPPAWGIIFPPYGVAKLTALMRTFGYSVKVYEANVQSYFYLLEEHGQNYWRTDRYFLWVNKENFEKYLLPDLEKLLRSVVDDIIKSNARVVGLSLFNTNVYAGIFIAKALREINPDICILAGGPETITGFTLFEEGGPAHDLFNYIFVGESEDNLINLLEDMPDTLPMNEVIGTTNSRLKLEQYPYADYTDYDIKNYTDHGVCIETSRGCIAQCSFCTETYFWKFRSLDPIRVVDEMEYYAKTYKVRRFWFVDSLANGNLKNFEQFINELLKRKLGIKWHSYARCDGRMDFIFIRKIAATGCTALAFGIESGSQKVLLDMRKKIEVWEIENNLRDARKSGIYNHSSWMIGFPTEEAVDNFHSMQVLFNIRRWLETISLGHTTAISPKAEIETDYRLFKIVGKGDIYDYHTMFLNNWYTDDFKNTVIQRFIRYKFAYIWLELLKKYLNSTIINPQQTEPLDNFYTFDCIPLKNIPERIEQDFFVNFNQFTSGSLSDNIANEYIGICYLLYKYFNRCSFTYKFDPNIDRSLFGDLLVRNYWANIEFTINKKGNYKLIIDHKLIHDANEEFLKENYSIERERLGDMSFSQRIEKNGHISEWQTINPQIRETIHEQYKKKLH